MRRVVLLSSAVATGWVFSEFGETGEALAQCVATTDCASLGYTESSCANGGIKCPFANYWNCGSDTCVESGFKYECKGTGYTSGIGQICNNKYTSCTCTSGYEWENGECKKINTPSTATLGTCTGYAKNCSIGDILNSDGTCTTGNLSGKMPIGVIVYISPDGCGQAISLDNVFSNVDRGGAIRSCSFVNDSSLSSMICSNYIKNYYLSSVKNQDEALNGDLFNEPSSFYASSTLGKVEKSENSTTSSSYTTIYNWGWLYNAGVLYPLGYINYDAYYLGLDNQVLLRPVIEF